jgi:hypothetical protein
MSLIAARARACVGSQVTPSWPSREPPAAHQLLNALHTTGNALCQYATLNPASAAVEIAIDEGRPRQGTDCQVVLRPRIRWAHQRIDGGMNACYRNPREWCMIRNSAGSWRLWLTKVMESIAKGLSPYMGPRNDDYQIT